MAQNDTVNVTFVPFEGQDDVVAWASATAVVTAIEDLINHVVRDLLLQRHLATVEQVGRLPKTRAMLAASPRKGSILLQLVFSIPDLSNVMTIEMQPALISGDAMSKKLASLADAATLIEFARRFLFEDWGVLAQRTKSPGSAAPRNDDEVVFGRAAAEKLLTLEPVIINLMEAANKTQCQVVEVQSGDGSSISIRRASPRADRARMGRVASNSPAAKVGRVFTRNDDQAIKVEYEGKTYDCIAATAGNDSIPLLFLWGSRQELPAPHVTFEVQGWPIARRDLSPLEDVPDAWTEARGVWLANKAKPFIDFD